MADEVRTKKIRLELLEEHAVLFKQLQKALGHDEPEQTFSKMVELLQAAILLTSRDQPTVKLYTRDVSRSQKSSVFCPTCKKEFPIGARLESDGFRELSVRLI